MDAAPRAHNIADTIFHELRRRILSGELAAGDRLPGERELAAKYGTNRNTLREAVRKLEQSNLVTVRHGQGVTVSDFRKTGTLELLPPFLATGPEMSEVVHIVEDVLAPRIMLLEYAARVAAERADQSDRDRLRGIADLVIAAFEKGDAQVVARGFQRWMDALVDATHSVAVRWIANPFFVALSDFLERFPELWILDPGFPAHLERLVAAIIAGNAETASAETRAYYEQVDRKLLGVVRRMGGSSEDNPIP